MDVPAALCGPFKQRRMTKKRNSEGNVSAQGLFLLMDKLGQESPTQWKDERIPQTSEGLYQGHFNTSLREFPKKVGNLLLVLDKLVIQCVVAYAM